MSFNIQNAFFIKFLLAAASLFLGLNLYSQVYYTNNGTNLPDPKADTIYVKKGIFKGYDAEFGTMLVKENRNNPSSKLIDIPVVKVHAIHKNINPPVFLLNGGPGISNIWEDNFPDFLLDSFDIIMVGYRGVDGKVKLDSKSVKTFIYNTPEPLLGKNFELFENEWKKQIDSINKIHDLAGYTIDEVCRDIASYARFYNYDSINFYAYSYGTILAQKFNYLYPEKVSHNIFISPRPINENNFKYNDTLILKHLFDSLLTFHFKLKKREIEHFYQFLNTDLPQITGLDKSKFYLSTLNNLYEIETTITLMENILDAMKGNNKDLLSYQNKLHTYFDKLVCIDCLTKRYSINNRLISVDDTSSFFSQTIAFANKFWNSAPEINSTLSLQQNDISVATFLFFGKDDFVSSYNLAENELLPYLKNAAYIIINNAAHQNTINSTTLYKKEIIRFLMN